MQANDEPRMTNDAGEILVEVANQQSRVELDERLLREAVTLILRGAGVNSATVSLALVDDATIARLHGQYLDDDEPTDVMSFLLDRGEGRIEGEVVASATTAAATAPRYNWPPQHELLLYVIHGMLHLVGYGDATASEQAEMRRQETLYLKQLGISRADSGEDAAPRNVD